MIVALAVVATTVKVQENMPSIELITIVQQGGKTVLVTITIMMYQQY